VFLEDFQKLKNHYVKGAKKISLKSTSLNIESKSLDLEFKKSFGNFHLLFSKAGALTLSLHSEYKLYYKVTYSYSKSGLLLAAMNTSLSEQILYSTSVFKYDNSGNLIFERFTPFDDASVSKYEIEERTLSYKDNYVEVNFKDNKPEKCFLTYSLNPNKDIIEEKMLRNDALVYWERNEYNIDRSINRIISLNEDGKQDGVDIYLPYLNGLETGFRHISQGKEFTKEYQYQFNEKGHWTNKTILLDGEPQYFYDREIVYY
jgi:hypothetical protein